MREYKAWITIMAVMAVFVLMGMPGQARGGPVSYEGVKFPLGNKSFADKVIHFTPGKGTGERDAAAAIGPPDARKKSGSSIIGSKGDVTLGRGGSIIVKFTDNYLIDVKGLDLYIFEFGPSVEAFKVGISKDGVNWIDLGIVRGQPTGLDIHDKVAPGDKFSYVKITDVNPYVPRDPKTIGKSVYEGSDIDAVGAIGSEERHDADADEGSSAFASGTYRVTQGHWESTWRVRVVNGRITGTSEWTCCPGHRIDPIRGNVSGNTVVMERNCSGQGWNGPCRQIFRGEIKNNRIMGTCTGTGLGGGSSWILYLNGGSNNSTVVTGNSAQPNGNASGAQSQGGNPTQKKWKIIGVSSKGSKQGSEVKANASSNYTGKSQSFSGRCEYATPYIGSDCNSQAFLIHVPKGRVARDFQVRTLEIGTGRCSVLGKQFFDGTGFAIYNLKGREFFRLESKNGDAWQVSPINLEALVLPPGEYRVEVGPGRNAYLKLAYHIVPSGGGAEGKGTSQTANETQNTASATQQPEESNKKSKSGEKAILKKTVCASARPSYTEGSRFKRGKFTIGGTAPQKIRLISYAENFTIRREDGKVVYASYRGKSWGNLTLNPGTYTISCSGGGAIGTMAASVCIEYPVTPPTASANTVGKTLILWGKQTKGWGMKNAETTGNRLALGKPAVIVRVEGGSGEYCIWSAVTPMNPTARVVVCGGRNHPDIIGHTLRPGTYVVIPEAGTSVTIGLRYRGGSGTGAKIGQVDVPVHQGKRVHEKKPFRQGVNTPSSTNLPPVYQLVIRPQKNIKASSLILKSGEKRRFIAWLEDTSGRKKNVTVKEWKVSNYKIGSIDRDGLFKAGTTEGNVEITAVVVDRKGKVFKATFLVAVVSFSPVMFDGIVELYDENGNQLRIPRAGIPVEVQGVWFKDRNAYEKARSGAGASQKILGYIKTDKRGKFRFGLAAGNYASISCSVNGLQLPAPAGYEWLSWPPSNNSSIHWELGFWHGPMVSGKSIRMAPEGARVYKLWLTKKTDYIYITGYVTHHGKPVDDAHVKLLDGNNNVVKETWSSSDGSYSFPVDALPKGSYRLTAGYKSKKHVTLRNWLVAKKDIRIELPLKGTRMNSWGNEEKVINIILFSQADKMGYTGP